MRKNWCIKTDCVLCKVFQRFLLFLCKSFTGHFSWLEIHCDKCCSFYRRLFRFNPKWAICAKMASILSLKLFHMIWRDSLQMNVLSFTQIVGTKLLMRQKTLPIIYGRWNIQTFQSIQVDSCGQLTAFKANSFNFWFELLTQSTKLPKQTLIHEAEKTRVFSSDNL